MQEHGRDGSASVKHCCQSRKPFESHKSHKSHKALISNHNFSGYLLFSLFDLKDTLKFSGKPGKPHSFPVAMKFSENCSASMCRDLVQPVGVFSAALHKCPIQNFGHIPHCKCHKTHEKSTHIWFAKLASQAWRPGRAFSKFTWDLPADTAEVIRVGQEDG